MSFYHEKLFPLLNERTTRKFVNHRRKLLQAARGDVLEIGFGSGLSIPCYPGAVTRLRGLEPSAGMRRKALSRLAEASFPVEMIAGEAESLPLPDASVDTVVSFLTLCSVTDLDLSLREIRRVLRPGGWLLFLEHMAQPPGTLTSRLQRALQPGWFKFACGCHLTRDTLSALAAHGFHVDRDTLKAVGYQGFPNILSPMYRGRASLS